MSGFIERIARDLDITIQDVRRLAWTAPRRYKVYYIDRRHGKGRRQIAQPTPDVKMAQRWLNRNVLATFPVHNSATAYVRGRGIRYNAERHVESNYLLKMDFKNFFPSILAHDLVLHTRKYSPYRFNEEEMLLLMRLLYWMPRNTNTLRLSIGAPSSPMLSNLLMWDFDNRVRAICDERNVIYTRYADDLAFSTIEPGVLHEINQIVESIVNELDYPKLRINDEKTLNLSKKHSRRLTGLVLSNEGVVSIGRHRKRTIRAMVHSEIIGELSYDDRVRLKGILAFCQDVEPAFVLRLKKRYGNDAVSSIVRGDFIRRS